MVGGRRRSARPAVSVDWCQPIRSRLSWYNCGVASCGGVGDGKPQVQEQQLLMAVGQLSWMWLENKKLQWPSGCGVVGV